MNDDRFVRYRSRRDRHDAEDAPGFAKGKAGQSGSFTEPDAAVDRLAYDVIGAAIEVHKALDPGFHESTYEEALVIEFADRGIPFARQFRVDVTYRGFTVGESRLDLVVGGELVVERNAVEQLSSIHVSQVLSYVKAMDLQLGLRHSERGPPGPTARAARASGSCPSGSAAARRGT